MRKTFCLCENTFVFATWIVQCNFFLNPKFPVSSHLCMYSSVFVGPIRKPHCWFSHVAAISKLAEHPPILYRNKQNIFSLRCIHTSTESLGLQKNKNQTQTHKQCNLSYILILGYIFLIRVGIVDLLGYGKSFIVVFLKLCIVKKGRGYDTLLFWLLFTHF